MPKRYKSAKYGLGVAVAVLVCVCSGCAASVESGSTEGSQPFSDSEYPYVGACPPDTQAPIPTPLCDGEREDPEGKWSDADAAFWQADDQLHFVLIHVRGGLNLCSTPVNDAVLHDYLVEWNRSSQQCVREALSALDRGGGVLEMNAISARLAWSDIQVIGELPDVISIRALGR